MVLQTFCQEKNVLILLEMWTLFFTSHASKLIPNKCIQLKYDPSFTWGWLHGSHKPPLSFHGPPKMTYWLRQCISLIYNSYALEVYMTPSLHLLRHLLKFCFISGFSVSRPKARMSNQFLFLPSHCHNLKCYPFVFVPSTTM